MNADQMPEPWQTQQVSLHQRKDRGRRETYLHRRWPEAHDDRRPDGQDPLEHRYEPFGHVGRATPL